MASFLDLLNTKASEIEKPPVLPMGTFLWKINKAHKESTTGKGDYNIITIPIVPVSVYEEADDVDPDLLAEFGNLAVGANSLRFMFPTDPTADVERQRTINQLKSFLLDVARVEADEEATIKELLAKMVGCEFVAQSVHRHVAETDTTYVDVKNYMPAE